MTLPHFAFVARASWKPLMIVAEDHETLRVIDSSCFIGVSTQHRTRRTTTNPVVPERELTPEPTRALQFV